MSLVVYHKVRSLVLGLRTILSYSIQSVAQSMQWILGNVWFCHTTVEEVFLTPNTLCRYNEELKRVMVMKDLGVIFSSDFKFEDNLTYLINKAKKKLGFVIRSTYDFKRPNTILPLFKSFVVPVLTYTSRIQSPSTQQDHYHELEKLCIEL